MMTNNIKILHSTHKH